jgi:4-hydroxy-tetrahydrodipicolinate synthase
MSIFTGSGVAIVTPFYDDYTINYKKLNELIDFHVESETDAIIIAGTTGESSTMEIDEQAELIKRCCDYTNKRVPVIAGTGSNCTAEAIKLSTKAEEAGADGLLVVTPYYNKGNNEGFIRHFKEIAKNVKIPILLYNVPSRTGVNLSIEVIEKLSTIENIVGIKEASGDISYVAEIRRRCPEDFDIYSGNDDIIVPVLSLGGKGVISVVANIEPKKTHNIVINYLEGRVEESRNQQLAINGFVNSLFIESNPIPIKKAMNLAGYDVGPLRLPLYEMSQGATAKMVKEMKDIGIEVK